MKPKIFTFAFLSLMLSGCYTTSYKTEDKQANDEGMQQKKLSLEEGRMLTAVFKDSLYRPELEYFLTAYGFETKKKTSSNSQVLDATAAVTDFTLSYTDVWADALARGNLVEAGVTMLGAGYVLDKLLTDDTPNRTTSGYYKALDINTDELSKGMSDTIAQTVLVSIDTTLNAIGYSLDSERQTELVKVDTSNPTVINLYYRRDNFEQFKEGNYWPRKIIVRTYFAPLRFQNAGNSTLVYSGQNEWQVYLYGSSRSTVEEYFADYKGLALSHGADLDRFFYSSISRDVPGFYFSHRGNSNLYYHVREGHYEGKLYRFYDQLTPEVSIIEGEITNFNKDNMFFEMAGIQ